eukprot:NODE_97_length_20652_cov_0.832093.p10 type:complete len:232 gc:universal NODE_97_length_20652_cov_0.832093:15154-15849(+)
MDLAAILNPVNGSGTNAGQQNPKATESTVLIESEENVPWFLKPLKFDSIYNHRQKNERSSYISLYRKAKGIEVATEQQEYSPNTDENIHSSPIMNLTSVVESQKMEAQELKSYRRKFKETKRKNQKLRCDNCELNFSTPSGLYRHKKSVHSKGEGCPFCLKEIKMTGRPDNNRKHLMKCPVFIQETQRLDIKDKDQVLRDHVKLMTRGLSEKIPQYDMHWMGSAGSHKKEM